MTPKPLQINATHDWHVEDGPSREELFDALRLSSEGRVVHFTVRKRIDDDGSMTIGGVKTRIRAHVHGVKNPKPDGHKTGFHWIVEVKFLAVMESPDGVGVWRQLDRYSPLSTLYYESKSRKGEVEVAPDDAAAPTAVITPGSGHPLQGQSSRPSLAPHALDPDGETFGSTL